MIPLFVTALALATAVLAPATPAAAFQAPAVPPPPTPSAAGPANPFLPDTLLSPPGGPRLVLLGTPGSGVAALRLSVPLREGPAEAGAGHLLRELALDRMRTLARPVGARVAVTRTPWGLAYAVEGAAADFEYLAYLLREAVSRPDVADVPFTRARQRLEEEVARTTETPAGRLAAELRRSVAPADPPTEGTPGSVRRLDPARVLEVWRRTHQAPRMTLVVSAGVLPEVVLAATRGLGSDEAVDAAPLDAPAPPEGRPGDTQSLRTWYGRAWTGGSPDSPLGPVTALLLSRSLEDRDGDFETTLQLRELPDRWALVVMGAAYPRRAAPMRAAVSGALEALEARLDEGAAARAAARVRTDVLYRARTPLGLVGVVGRAMEHSGDPASAARYLESLDEVGLADVRAFVDALGAGPGATAEVRR